MRPVTLNLGVLIRDPVNDNAWPGADEVIEFNDATCPAVDDEETSWLVEQVFVVMGYDSNQGDSLPAPAGWQVFSMEEATPLIPFWFAEDLEFHAATKITCSNDPDNFYVVGDSFYDVVNAFNVCCGAPNIQTQALSLKLSNRDLEPGVEYPCGTQAVFTWLVIYGNNETRPNLSARFDIVLTRADMSESLAGSFSSFVLPPTGQIKKAWPDDFIGMTIDGINLVANTVPPGPSDRQVKDFDFGTIQVTANVLDENFDVIITDSNTWALPGTQCGAGCISPYPDPITFPPATLGVPYTQVIQLAGAGPWAFTPITAPDWLEGTLNPANGEVTYTGIPDVLGDNLEVTFKAENCGEPITEETPFAEIVFDVKPVFEFLARTSISNQPWYKVCWANFLGLFVAVSQQDGSGTQVATSPDGITWTLRSTPGNVNWNDVVAFESLGRVVAVGTGDTGAVMWSDDGILWTAANIELGQWRGVTPTEDQGAVLTVGSLGSNRVQYSSNAVGWDPGFAPNLNNWYSIAYSPELQLFVAVAITGTGNQVMTATSTDFETWTPRTTPGPSRTWFKVIWCSELGLFIAVSGTGPFSQRVMTSPDGIIWNLRTAANVNAAWLGLAYGDGLLVAVANTAVGPEKQAMKSFDGITWEEVDAPASPWTSVAYNGSDRFVAVGTNVLATADW